MVKIIGAKLCYICTMPAPECFAVVGRVKRDNVVFLRRE